MQFYSIADLKWVRRGVMSFHFVPHFMSTGCCIAFLGHACKTTKKCVRVSVVSAPSTWAEVPGGPGRWTLPDVDTGLNSMADMYTAADSMATQITLYTTLQGITMQLLILRFIRVLSAQKRLSILTTTAVKASHCTSGPTYHPAVACLCWHMLFGVSQGQDTIDLFLIGLLYKDDCKHIYCTSGPRCHPAVACLC